MINLPLFPLNLVLLPYELLPLHIFEPRYKKMVKDHIEQDKPFGIILNEDNIVCTKGCRVKVQKVYKKYSNGGYDILVKGVEQFKVINTRVEGETVIGEIDYVPINSDGDEQLRRTIQELYLQVLIKVGISKFQMKFRELKRKQRFRRVVKMAIQDAKRFHGSESLLGWQIDLLASLLSNN